MQRASIPVKKHTLQELSICCELRTVLCLCILEHWSDTHTHTLPDGVPVSVSHAQEGSRGFQCKQTES